MPKHRIYEIADELEVGSKEMLKMLEELGMGELTPLNTVGDEEYELILDLYEDQYEAEEEQEELEVEEEEREEEEEQPAEEEKVEEEREGSSRPPVISVLGHIDHGKTTLLDQIRETNTTDREAGGITQSIGAYQIEWDGQTLTFIDTPGHKAFTEMRSRGAQATDIAILVIAADDGIMDQTVEAINHIEAAGIPMIVAINKIDKSNANTQQVMNQLAQRDLTPDDWGGDVITVPLSALTGDNVDEILDMIGLVAQMEDFRADPEGELSGYIIDSHLDSNKGPLATAVIENGTIHNRDIIVVGDTHGRIRAMSDESGRVEEAGPGKAVEIMGLKEVPSPGSKIESYENLSEAKSIAEERKEESEERRRQPSRSVEDIFELAQKDELDLIIKARSGGALDAVRKELEDLDSDEVEIEILHEGVGDISKSDIMLAASSDDYAAVLGFGVGVSSNVRQEAEQLGIAVDTYEVIYDLVDRIKEAIGDIVGPTYEEKKVGEAEVRQIFGVSDVGTIAGCYVREGKVTNDSIIRVIRNGEEVHKSKVSNLKRFEEDVTEVGQDYECGVRLEDFDEVQEGDVLVAYERQVVDVV